MRKQRSDKGRKRGPIKLVLRAERAKNRLLRLQSEEREREQRAERIRDRPNRISKKTRLRIVIEANSTCPVCRYKKDMVSAFVVFYTGCTREEHQSGIKLSLICQSCLQEVVKHYDWEALKGFMRAGLVVGWDYVCESKLPGCKCRHCTLAKFPKKTKG